MKKRIAAMTCFALFTATAQAQKSASVPAAVKAAFDRKFPSAKATAWEKETGGYEASFRQDGQTMTASFDVAGAWMETEREIRVSKLPASARHYLEVHYKGKKPKEAAELERADGSTRFEAEIDGIDVLFDGKGAFLTTQKG